MAKLKLKKDKFSKARGGKSKLFGISCEHCKTYLFNYQKDGPGLLKRMYIDRISKAENFDLSKNLICPSCNRLIATQMTYEKEDRPALRLFVGAVTKKTIK